MRTTYQISGQIVPPYPAESAPLHPDDQLNIGTYDDRGQYGTVVAHCMRALAEYSEAPANDDDHLHFHRRYPKILV